MTMLKEPRYLALTAPECPPGCDPDVSHERFVAVEIGRPGSDLWRASCGHHIEGERNARAHTCAKVPSVHSPFVPR